MEETTIVITIAEIQATGRTLTHSWLLHAVYKNWHAGNHKDNYYNGRNLGDKLRHPTKWVQVPKFRKKLLNRDQLKGEKRGKSSLRYSTEFFFLSGAFARAKSPFQILVKNEVTGLALLNVLHCLTSEHVTALRRGDFIFCINPSKKIRTATNRVWNKTTGFHRRFNPFTAMTSLENDQSKCEIWNP